MTPAIPPAKDDRYRVRQDTVAISEALWHAAHEYGITERIDVGEQVAVARTLRAVLAGRSGPLRVSDIDAAFRKFDLRKPPSGFGRMVVDRLERLDR